jgi:hypothetical protein
VRLVGVGRQRGERWTGQLTAAATGAQGATAPTGATADAAASRVSRAVRALRTAGERVSRGRPYDLETERYKGKRVWEVKVASGNQRPYK